MLFSKLLQIMMLFVRILISLKLGLLIKHDYFFILQKKPNISLFILLLSYNVLVLSFLVSSPVLYFLSSLLYIQYSTPSTIAIKAYSIQSVAPHQGKKKKQLHSSPVFLMSHTHTQEHAPCLPTAQAMQTAEHSPSYSSCPQMC